MIPVKEPHRITSKYGKRKSPITSKEEFHPGIDIVNVSGDHTLYAVADGVIVDDKDNYDDSKRWIPKGGNTVGNRIYQRSEIDGKIYYITYFHMAYNTVKVGQKISKGDVIGEYADVGMSKGAHVHLQCWDEQGYKINKTIDPTFLLEV